MSLLCSARRNLDASSSLDLVAVPFPIPPTLGPSGVRVSLSPALLLRTNFVGIETLPLSPLLEDGLAVVGVPATVLLEVTFAVLIAPLTDQDTVTGGAVAIRLAQSPAAAGAGTSRPGRSDGSLPGIAVTQPASIVR